MTSSAHEKSAYGLFTSKQFVQKIKIKQSENLETATFGSAKIAFSSSIDGIGHSLYSRAKKQMRFYYLL